MKKLILAGLVAASVANAELINISPSALLQVEGVTVSAGYVLEIFQDVNSDNGATYYNDIRLDNTGSVTGTTGGNTSDDVAITLSGSLTSVDAGGGNIVISSLIGQSVNANDALYTVIYNASSKGAATEFAVFESTPYVVAAGVGVTLPNGTYGVGSATGNWQVIPEPATIGLLGIAGAGLFAARRKTQA